MAEVNECFCTSRTQVN